MENDRSRTRDTPTQTARTLLQDLAGDRAALAGRLRAPGWLYPALGALAAVYVASPAIPADGPRRTLVLIAAVTTILLSIAYQRISGVKLGRTGVLGVVIVAAGVATVLLFLSVSYGLALLSPWWVIAPAAVAFGVVVALGRWLEKVHQGEVRRDR